MNRAATLFAITSIACVVFGLLSPKLLPNESMSISFRSTGYALPFQIPCYGLAALFCLFACMYSTWLIPFGVKTSQWHYWLSFAGIVLFAIGFAGLNVAERQTHAQGSVGLSGTLMLASYLISFPVFFGAHLLFLIMLMRGILKLHRS